MSDVALLAALDQHKAKLAHMGLGLTAATHCDRLAVYHLADPFDPRKHALSMMAHELFMAGRYDEVLAIPVPPGRDPIMQGGS